MGRTRALIAAVLATVYPGLGHLYLRSWFRAITWFGLSLLTAAIVVPPEFVSAVETGGLDTIVEASREIPTDAYLAILAVRVMNVIDAAWIGLRPRRTSADAEGPTCPNCGRELDEELDFCHWCTAPLEASADESRADSGLF